ncbi:MAG TPA: CHAT domain-containing protein [candidate division WOR-3 bacterium]|uniref:CHAT domain-containing protein n=1 Tax=candidate division WOR-3 bacterium TaxID=2052148 RepID=A0A9C9END4_UNCW3|nr:CHAT domain-containing protein [candidate division WOR-3 bacterium]
MIFLLFFLITKEEPVGSLLDIADSLFYNENFAQAETIYIELLKTVQGIDRGLCLKGLGNIALCFGDPAAADDYYTEALKIFKKEKYLSGEAKIYLNFGSLAFYQGELSRAQKYFNDALKTIGRVKEKTISDRIDESNVLMMLGRLFLAKRRYKDASDYLLRAVERSKSIDYKKGIIDGCYFLGSLFVQQAVSDSALEYFSASCSLSLKHRYYKSAYEAYREIGNVQRRMGEYDAAYRNFLCALNLADSIKAGKEFLLGEGELLHNIALLYIAMGKYHSALTFLFRARDIFEKMKNITWKRETFQNIGFVYTLLATEDESYYDSSLYYYDLANDLIKDKQGEAHYYNNLGVLYEKKGEYKTAEGNYKKALKLYQDIDDRLGAAKVLSNLGNLFVLQGDYKKAVADYKRAYRVIENIKREDWKASLLANLGFAQHRSGVPDEAIESLTDAVAIIEDLRGKITGQDFRSAYLDNKIRVYEELINIYYQQGKAEEAFNYAERAKARAFLDLLAGAELTGKEGLDSEVVSLIKKEQMLEKKIEFLAGTLEQRDVIMEHNNVLDELERVYPEYTTLKSVKPIEIKRLQSILDDATAIVEYFIGVKNAYVFVVTSTSLSVKKIDVPAVRIYEKVDKYRKIIKRRVNYTDDELLVLSEWFYTFLLNPLMTEIQNKERLCIIPYGVLHHLPFAAIVIGKDPLSLLIDRYDIFYAPSASVYEIARRKNKSRKAKAVIFAKADFSEHPEWFDLSLPGTKEETDSILATKALPDLRIFSDADSSLPQPSETNAKRFLKDFDIIHFATHGKLAPGDSALESRIILSKDEKNDGYLKVREIFNLEIDAYLVTLSACETGQLRGFSEVGLMGDELTGLSRAFIYAGSSSVVASLWKVSDLSTVLLMMRFYQNLKDTDKTNALCNAQRWLKKQEFLDRPFFWAPFVVIGDWR